MNVGADGVVTRNGATYDILFERRLKQPIEKVWAAITEPARIADWFTPMSFEPDLRLGAKVTVAFGPDDVVRGEVTSLDPPRVFAYRELHADGTKPVLRFQLEPDGAGTRLVFSQTGLGGKSRDGMSVNAAGWHEFLDQLVDLVGGSKVTRSGLAQQAGYKAAVDGLWGSDDPNGFFRKTGAACEVVFRRHLRRPLHKVWAAITTPERIGDWLADVTIDGPMRVGTRFELTFYSGYRTRCEVVAMEPMRLFTWTWGLPEKPGDPVSVVRFELEPAADGCVLTLTNDGLSGPAEDLVSVAGGWHIHLEALPGAADGVRTAPDVEVEKRLQDLYRPLVAALR